MNLENRIGFPSKAKALKLASATVVVTLPLAGYFAKRELSLRKIRSEEQKKAELRREALMASDDSINSGDSGLIFSRE